MKNPQARHTATGKGSHFRWSRFAALARVDFAERWRIYAAVLLIALVVQLLLHGWAQFVLGKMRPMDVSTQQGWYNVFLCIFGIPFMFVLHAPMYKQGSGLLMLMRPASTFEKWLHAALLMLVAFPLAYTVVYLLATVPLNGFVAMLESANHAKARLITPNAITSQSAGFHVYLPFLRADDRSQIDASSQWMFQWFYTVIAGFGAFALVRFRHAAPFKTLALAFILLILSLFVLSLSMFTDGETGALTHWIDGSRRVDLNASTIVSNLLFWLGTPALVWWSAYLALRERDLT
ncbi:hypothetical protein [Diaphorobacter aerolatus]|uniref:Uncharacterized protein n=1 Tax=Diaphorobacter aerolatus TaxID=1288495 RepID=A0A7H0GIG1_9BURK|nr:hypothetical protein [Diaphorobacter aerolatus]QNP48077.1 hypothetical protein H9K75_18695 [Diaphorobacter aerolatus]